MTVKVEKSVINNPIRVENPYKGLDYNLLNNIPTVDGKEVKGDMTTEQLIGFDKDYVDETVTSGGATLVQQHNADEAAHPYILQKFNSYATKELVENSIDQHDLDPMSHNALISPLASKTELSQSISQHNTSAAAHQDIRNTITNDIYNHNVSNSAHQDIRNVLSQKASQSDLTEHIQDLSNPHEVTKTQVGLGNVDNTSDLNKPVSSATQAALDQKAEAETVAQLQTELSRKQDDTDFHPEDYGWPDIRPAARPNAIAIMAGVKADYSAYDNWGFTATCEGGYNVYIDGVQYGSTFSSGAQCSITWSQYSATTGFSVSYPEELTAHIVQIAPAVSGNNITAFASARIASSGDEAQGMIWLHYNLSNEISLNNATRNYPNSRNTNLVAVTAKKGIIKATNTYGFISSLSPKLTFSPNLDLTSGIAYLADGNICGVGVKTLEIKNINSTAATFSSAFANCTALEKVKFTDTETGNISNFSQLFLNCTNLKELPNINYTNAANMTSFITNAKSLKDFVLDLSYAGNLNTFGVYGNSSNRVDGLKGLLVSQNAPFTGSSPQINVSYTGLDQNALVALFNSLPTVTSGQIINITGATGASALTAQQLAIATNKGWTVTR